MINTLAAAASAAAAAIDPLAAAAPAIGPAAGSHGSLGAVGMVFFVDRDRDLLPADELGQAHEGVRRFRERRMVVEAAQHLRPRLVGNVEYRRQ